MIYILTGPIKSGKTRCLSEWSQGRHDVDGLISPDDTNGKRYFLKIQSNERFEFEANDEASCHIIAIGAYRFLKSAFDEANEYFIHLSKETTCKYLVVDELGKLELNNRGLHEAAQELIAKFINDPQRHLVLVVRDYLLTPMLEHYNISDYTLISALDLTEDRFT